MRMKTRIAMAVLLGAMIVVLSNVRAAEYFVNKQGNNANNGRSRETAFLTIQKGVNALKPGDTLTIGPGEYFENVKRENLGGPNADTLIRAEIPGTAVLRGDVPMPEFKKVEGYRFVYVAPFDKKPQAVLQHDTLRIILERANVSELEFNPGWFSYDADAKMLYLSRADFLSPEGRRYTVGVNENHGIDFNSPRRVVIEGLTVTGYIPGFGIFLTAPVSCVIRDCLCFMNVRGIVLRPTQSTAAGETGSDNLIENCVCYGNAPAGICRYHANNDVIRNCYTYKNVRGDGSGENFGIMHYHSTNGPLLIQNNIAWGQSFNFSVKPGGGHEKLENCVGLGYVRIAPSNMVHNVIGGGNEYDRRSSNAPADTVLFLREKDLDTDFEYADPLNMDYRLQSDSRFRGTGPDGSDRGAYPYKPNIFYVSPKGNDRADGLSMRKPWRTLGRALRGRKPGDTVYLVEGQYTAAPMNRMGDGKSPIRILGHGRGTVVMTGTLNVTGGAGIVFERLNFSDGAALNDSRDLTLKNCTFFGRGDGLGASGVQNLKVTHSVFAGVPFDVKRSRGVFLSGNLYANAGKAAVNVDAEAAILYSDYNSYGDAAKCWAVSGATRSFADLQKRHDRYSKTMAPKLVVAQGVPRLEDDLPFKNIGPGSTASGIHHEYDPTPEKPTLVGPFLHSTSDTTANIEWWITHRATFSLAWGDTPEMKNTVNRFGGGKGFNTYSLAGLKPNQTYYFKVVSADASNRQRGMSFPVLRPGNGMVSFKTAPRPAEPRTYYVAGNGNDANDGLSREKAFRSINRAAARVGPGDTVLIAEGQYNETVRIRAAGTEDRPITFRCAKGEKAIHWGEGLPRTFELVVKPDNRFDGLYFRGQGFWREGFAVRQSPRVRITRCHNTMVDASGSPGMLIENCVLQGGWNAIQLVQCRDSRVENNVFINTILRQLKVEGRGTVIARGNVFCECVRNKSHQTLLDLRSDVTETDNCFYLRWPVEEKLAVNKLPLPVYKIRTGSNAIDANPMMPGVPGFGSGWLRFSQDDDFDKFFSANPRLILRGIGLDPEAFGDFKLETAKWPYDRAWAEKFVAASDAADVLARAGKNVEALTAYKDMLEKTPMCDRLKADLLEKASLCAERSGNDDQAMQLAKSIPVTPLAIRRQMALLLKHKKYAELIQTFTEKNMSGVVFQSFVYPELEDVIEDLYYYRSLAYRETGDLKAAEADLMVMYKKHQRHPYRAGESIQEHMFLRLGNLYRDYFKDDRRALEQYLKVCDRTTWASWGTPSKPVLMGDDETLIEATKAACDILRKQGKLDKVKELQENLAKAQAEAAAALRKE